MTDMVYWYVDNLNLDYGTALALDFPNSAAPEIALALAGVGALLILIARNRSKSERDE